MGTCYRLDNSGVGNKSSGRLKNFIFSTIIHTGSGAHPTSYIIGTGGSLPQGVKRPGCEANHSS
jgi:hypothetical protein